MASTLNLESIKTRWFLKPRFVVAIVICPRQPPGPHSPHALVKLELNKLPHLTVDVRIPQQQIFTLQGSRMSVMPRKTERVHEFIGQKFFIARELFIKCCFQIQVRAARHEKLHCLSQSPAILLHKICGHHATRSGLTAQRVDKYAFCVFECCLNKMESFVGNHITLIQNYLTFRIHPVVSQVGHSNHFPSVNNLAATTIDNTCNFVGDNELQILCCELISDEQSVLNFYRTQDFIIYTTPRHH